MNKNPATAVLFFAALLAAALLSGCHDDISNGGTTPTAAPPDTTSSTPPAATETVLPRADKPGKGVIYVATDKPTADDSGLVPQTVTLRDAENPARDAVNALIQSPSSPLPAGIALRGITLRDSVAILDFSQNPVDETHGEGKQSEALTALLRTLGQFPAISKVQVMVQGKPINDFGEFAASGPVDVIRPTDSQAAAGTKDQ